MIFVRAEARKVAKARWVLRTVAAQQAKKSETPKLDFGLSGCI